MDHAERIFHGDRLRAVGLQPDAAEYGGVKVGSVWVRALALSGALAGLGGLNYVLGYKHYYEEGFATGSGFLGIAVALGIGALGNLLGSTIAGVPTVWDISAAQIGGLFVANVLNMLIGFMLGVLIRNSPGAIVGYFVYSFVLTGATEVLAAAQEWFREIRGWVDINYAQGALFDTHSAMTGEQWANLAVTSTVWILLPLVVGLTMLRRSEVS